MYFVYEHATSHITFLVLYIQIVNIFTIYSTSTSFARLNWLKHL